MTGFSPTESIDLTSKSTVSKILSGVAQLESGSEVPEEYIEQVYDVIYNDSVNINISNNNINNKKMVIDNNGF